MYSPKIAEDLVPLLYALAKSKGIPMTKLVDDLLRESLNIEGIRGDDCQAGRSKATGSL